MDNLKERTALVTGASRGLGLALARGLAARRWNLIITARDAERLRVVRNELARVTHVAALPGDVTDQAHRDALAVLAPLGVLQALRDQLKPGARVINVTSDAGKTAYPGWGGYGASKAALEQLSAVLAVENPELKVYWVDPGDMRTDMHQAAYPGEDISDRPLPDARVPGFIALLESDLPSGRYSAAELEPASAGAA